MLNTASVQAVEKARFSQAFTQPLYDSYCFANLPATILTLLTGEGSNSLPIDVFGSLPRRYQQVILFFVDGFGWRFLQRYAERFPLLRLAFEEGTVSLLTAQFPSTTAAHTTTIHTGLEVGQSGIYEWTYYEPLVDEVIAPLLFSYAGELTRDTLMQCGLPPSAFYPQQTFYEALGTYGVRSTIFQHRSYTPSTFSNAVFRGASVHAFDTLSQALDELRDHLLSAEASKTTPAYYLLYFDQIDAAGHRFGPDSSEFEEAVEQFWTALETGFYRPLQGKLKETLLVLTADHGMVPVYPETTIYLNQQAPELVPLLRTTRQGRPLVAAGSARDMFLYVREEALDEALALLKRLLAGRAEVYPTQELIDKRFFGREVPSERFLQRVGNVVLLPYEGESVWWFEKGRFEMRFHGHHGGLTPAEMQIPLLLLPV
ncbi:alkaline phosphatase family protein [Thermogemmatispora sp.]|uniref:alkaline phosphatase family protein n=1 Tax=Thermogemmatispora sp. TaxID=1968838 RepID=UPI001DE91F65|nr:alkaline phosphatase family protein [Thermogemmatispora sp.]MBX5450079.1 alkaline phosphatase family protein [Thermogemmatispora sp.]